MPLEKRPSPQEIRKNHNWFLTRGTKRGKTVSSDNFCAVWGFVPSDCQICRSFKGSGGLKVKDQRGA
jgi:hypothetical protein